MSRQPAQFVDFPARRNSKLPDPINVILIDQMHAERIALLNQFVSKVVLSEPDRYARKRWEERRPGYVGRDKSGLAIAGAGRDEPDFPVQPTKNFAESIDVHDGGPLELLSKRRSP